MPATLPTRTPIRSPATEAANPKPKLSPARANTRSDWPVAPPSSLKEVKNVTIESCRSHHPVQKQSWTSHRGGVLRSKHENDVGRIGFRYYQLMPAVHSTRRILDRRRVGS